MTSLIESVFGPASHRSAKGGILTRLNNAMALHRSRVRLQDLEPHMLEDIGLTEKDAMVEANRPIWDAPSTWKV